MKKILVFLSIISFFASCIKNNVEPLGDVALNKVRFSATPALGSAYPSKLYVPDLSVEEEFISLEGLRAKFEGSTTSPSNVYLVYKVNPEALAKYNAEQQAKNPNFKQFYLLPDSTYTIMVKNDTIKAGEVYAAKDSFNIKLYPQKINTTINYILPFSVTSTQFPTASGTGNILFYLIGNPIAGGYNWDFSRWNVEVPTGARSSGWTGDATTFIPKNGTTVEVKSGYYIEPRYVITFTDNNGVLSDFKVAFHPDDLKALNDNGVEVKSGPNLLIADPIAKRYKIQYLVWNGSAFRYLIDEFYK